MVVAYTSTKNVTIGCLMIHDRSGETSVRVACSVCSAMIGTSSQQHHHEAAPPHVRGRLPRPTIPWGRSARCRLANMFASHLTPIGGVCKFISAAQLVWSHASVVRLTGVRSVVGCQAFEWVEDVVQVRRNWAAPQKACDEGKGARSEALGNTRFEVIRVTLRSYTINRAGS